MEKRMEISDDQVGASLRKIHAGTAGAKGQIPECCTGAGCATVLYITQNVIPRTKIGHRMAEGSWG